MTTQYPPKSKIYFLKFVINNIIEIIYHLGYSFIYEKKKKKSI